jgi:tetratricopeptide (TPR) repeat protein
MIIFVPLQDISGMEGRDFKNDTDAEVIARLRQVYDFLPKETNISVKDGIVRIDIPESAIANKEEAVRLLDKGSERAKQGEYQKAVGIFSRVLELDPSNVEARRNLEDPATRARLLAALDIPADPQAAAPYIVARSDKR